MDVLSPFPRIKGEGEKKVRIEANNTKERRAKMRRCANTDPDIADMRHTLPRYASFSTRERFITLTNMSLYIG